MTTRKYRGYDFHRVYVRYAESGEHDVCWPSGEFPLDPAPSRALLDLSWGFLWGASTRSSKQLALAILQSEFGDKYAIEHYEAFDREVIARIVDPRTHGDPRFSFMLDGVHLDMWRHRDLIAEAQRKAEAALAEGRVNAPRPV